MNLFGETHLWEVFAMYEEKPKTQSQSSQYYNCNYAHTMDSMTDEEIVVRDEHVAVVNPCHRIGMEIVHFDQEHYAHQGNRFAEKFKF